MNWARRQDERVLEMVDKISELAWVWLGIRRRWILATFMALWLIPDLVKDQMNHRPLIVISWIITLGLFTLRWMDHKREKNLSTDVYNGMRVMTRTMAVITAFRWVALLYYPSAMLIIAAAGHYVDLLISFSSMSYLLMSDSLISSKPRKRIRLPQLYFPTPLPSMAG